MSENKPTGWYVFTRERLYCQGDEDYNNLRKKVTAILRRHF